VVTKGDEVLDKFSVYLVMERALTEVFNSAVDEESESQGVMTQVNKEVAGIMAKSLSGFGK
jgi:hypothetical protein